MTTADPSDDQLDLLPDWEQQARWWDVAFILIMLLVVPALPFSGVQGSDLLTAYAGVAAILLAYLVWGRRAARSRDQRQATAYVVVLVPACGVALAQGGMTGFLLFAAFAQVWMLLEPTWRAVVASVALAAASATGIVLQTDDRSVGAWFSAAPQMLVPLLFALLLGLFYARMVRQTEAHARLLAELRATQSELAATHHAAGVAAERERLAGEIHDTLAQGFMSVVTQAQAAAAALDGADRTTVRERLAVIEQVGRDNLAEARTLVAAFSPVALQDGGLVEAVRRLAERFTAETGVSVTVTVDDAAGPARDAGTDVVLLRAAQEALANVRRHAQADAVEVRIDAAAGVVGLEVRDDGRGLGADHAEGIGLSGMRGRVASVGGSVEIGPGDDGGTRLRVQVPVAGGDA